MTEASKPKTTERKGSMKSTLTWVVLVAVAVLIFNNLQTSWYILLVALGFGAVIMIHEFGHFIVAKLSGIKVEAFSIGFPPTLLGLQKTEEGLRVRILPGPAKTGDEGEETAPDAAQVRHGTEFTIGKGNGKASDTEYRIGLVPFGGFVKMMGQEDAGAAEVTDDPRSFANKPVFVRIAVVAAGVIFNAISAFLIFMAVFLVGMELYPAAVGDVQLGSPAYEAGIRPGDRIVEVNGETFVDFTNVALAPALSARGEAIKFVVERPDGTRRPISLVAEQSAMSALPMRSLGIERAETLTIEPGIPNLDFFKPHRSVLDYGVHPGDVATAVDGEPLEGFWELRELVGRSLGREAVVTFERPGSGETVDAEIPLYWKVHRDNFQTEFDLCHVLGMTPRIQVMNVPPAARPRVWRSRIRELFKKETPTEEDSVQEKLQKGDIIVKAGDVEYPTYEELREATIAHEGRKMPITVLREEADGSERELVVNVDCEKTPNTDRVTFGIVPSLDAENAIVAATIATEGAEALAIPRGSRITKIGGEHVESFYDIAAVIRRKQGQRVELEYVKDGQAGRTELDVPADASEAITARSDFAVAVPFEYLKHKYKATGPVQAVTWGVKKTHMFVAQTYVTLQRLITREVSPKALSGPVGIVSMSYKIASQSIPEYIYFLGLISSCIAVMNLLPLPIVDGGVIVLLIIEKLRGGPINPRVQEAISYAGLVFLGMVFLWLTYNDILNILIN